MTNNHIRSWLLLIVVSCTLPACSSMRHQANQGVPSQAEIARNRENRAIVKNNPNDLGDTASHATSPGLEDNSAGSNTENEPSVK